MTSANYSEYFWVKNETSSSGIVTIKKNNTGAPTVTVEYSTDGTTWTTKGSTSTTSMTFTLAANSKIYLRATADCWSDLSLGFYYNYFSSGMNCSVGGNIMSLLWGSNFVVNNVVKKTFPNEDIQGILNGLFVSWTNLVDAGELVLPVTHIESTSGQMGNRCYRAMFMNCSNIVNGPHIDLRRENNQADVAFQAMFSGCTSLQNVTLNTQYGADSNMFQNVATNGVLYNQSGTDYSGTLPSTWTQNNIISLYFGYDRVTNWIRNNIEVDKVVDENNNVTIWEKPIDPKYLEPFYVENISNANETLGIVKYVSNAPTLTIEYSTDNAIWNTLGTTSTTALTRTLAPGEKVYLRCLCDSWNARYVQDGDYQYASNQIQGISKVGGNIMSLLYGNTFNGRQNTFKYGFYNFYQLFLGNTNLIDAEKLILTDKLHSHCYDSMFYYCTNLTKAPALPATSMKQFEWDPYNEYVVSISGSYASMFGKCYSLTQAPALPAIELSSACYYEIFGNCTSLRSAPALPATTLTSSCYQNMFNGCTSLNEVTCLATSNINTNNSTFYWLNNVSSTGTFYKKAGVTWPTGIHGIPSGWTVVEV